MTMPTQPGITRPVPGQEKEEPDLWQEDDIPSDDRGKGTASGTGERSQDKPENGRDDN